MAQDIKLIATLSGKQYAFEYENTTICSALEQFFINDCHPLTDDPDYGYFPIDLWLLGVGAHKPIQLMFYLGLYDHYYTKGWKADGPYRWSEFLADITESREEYERRKAVGIKNVSWSCKEGGKIVIVEFYTGNKYSVTCGKPFSGYRYFCEAIKNAEALRGDEQKFYNEIATGRYDNYLNG